jgi:putative spermidine/putrescine transport system substrate-binding protein
VRPSGSTQPDNDYRNTRKVLFTMLKPALPRSRRPLAALLGLLALSAALAACGGSEAVKDSRTSGEVTVMFYSGVVEENYTEAVIEPFMEKYPDIDVEYVPGESASQMLGVLRGEKSDPSTDVAMFDISVAETANKEGIFTPLDPSRVPNMKDVAERGQVEGNYGPAVTFDNLVLLYNTEQVPQAPASWNALWDKNVAGEVVIDAAPDIQGLSLMMILNQMAGANYEQTVQPAVDRLSTLSPNVQSWAPNPDPYTMITNGAASMGIGWNARAQFYSDESSQLGVSIPQEGSVFQTNTVNLVKGSDSPQAAQTFINYALSPKAQAAFAEQMFYAPTNTKTKLSPQVAERTATTPDRLAKIIDVNWSYVASRNDAWTDTWRREILGG